VLKSGLVKAADSSFIPDRIQFVINKNNITRGDMALMNIVAGQVETGWTRPVYFTGGIPFIGLDPYLQSEGLLKKFVPENKPDIISGMSPYTDLDKSMDLFLHKYKFGLANTNRVYYDEKNRLIFLVYRQQVASLALSLSLNGRKQDGLKVLDHFMSSVSEHSLPYDILLYDNSMMQIIQAYYNANAAEKGRKYGNKMEQNIKDEVKFFNSLSEEAQSGTNAYIVQQNLKALSGLGQIAQRYGDTTAAKQWNQTLQAIAPAMFRNPNTSSQP
jgi:hypothetical protein